MPEAAQREALISSTRAAESEPDPHRAAAIPPWVHANHDADNAAQSDPLLATLTPSRPNTRHYKPPTTHYKPGRKWDHLRSSEPPLLSGPIAEHQERWKGFMKSGPNPYEAQGRVVDAAWMEENMPDLLPGWQDENEKGSPAPLPHGVTAKGLMYKGKWLISPERQEKSVRLFWVSVVCMQSLCAVEHGTTPANVSPLQRLLLKNAYVPLIFRITVLAFTAAALGLAAAIYINVDKVNNDSDPYNQCATRASTFMAICVGSIAVPYIIYVTWDEYLSKPYAFLP